jgi:glycosyltransferase involved in cell wall biosynthesis
LFFGLSLVVVVVESHGDFEVSVFLHRRIYLHRLHRLAMHHVAQFAIKNADFLRAVSNSTEQQLRQLAPNKSIFQFRTWTDIDKFLRVGAKKSDHPRRDILFAGVLIPRKGIHHLLGAFALIAHDFPSARLVILGCELNKFYAAKLKALCKEYNLDGRVKFLGEVSQSELATRMDRALIFVLPTYSEGLPRVVFEAMAAGLPVIATAVSGIPEIVQDCITGFLIPPGDEKALAERLRWVLENPKEALVIGSRARAFVRRRLSTRAYVQGYKKIFEAAQLKLEEWEQNESSFAF